MDIEGMEYRVMTDLLVSGVFCQAIDTIWGEVHGQFFPQTLGAHRDKPLVLDKETGAEYWKNLMPSKSEITYRLSMRGGFVWLTLKSHNRTV